MTIPTFPSTPPYPQSVTMQWAHIETALKYLAVPEKAHLISETLSAIRQEYQTTPEKLVFTLISACAWLTDETASMAGSPNSTSFNGQF